MNDRFEKAMGDKAIRHDTVVVADFIQIWCDGHHAGLERARVNTDGAELGIYGRKRPVLCEECSAHLAYAEKRRAYCPKDPKPFCADCDTHCYRSDEREWQRQLMRYSGPKSWRKGHAIDGTSTCSRPASGGARWRATGPRTARRARSTRSITPENRPDREESRDEHYSHPPDRSHRRGALQRLRSARRPVRGGRDPDGRRKGQGHSRGAVRRRRLLPGRVPHRRAHHRDPRRRAVDHDAAAPIIAEKKTTYIAQHCFNCGASEDDRPLLPVRKAGDSTWGCTRCLPALIHGAVEVAKSAGARGPGAQTALGGGPRPRGRATASPLGLPRLRNCALDP